MFQGTEKNFKSNERPKYTDLFTLLLTYLLTFLLDKYICIIKNINIHLNLTKFEPLDTITYSIDITHADIIYKSKGTDYINV